MEITPTVTNVLEVGRADENKFEVDQKESGQDERMRIMPESLRRLSEAELKDLERHVVRKMDLVIMPIVAMLYVLNFLDRANLGAAKLQGIIPDLHMTTQQFAATISLLYVGYLPMQVPSNLIITRVSKPGLYICIAVIVWGIISMSTAVVKSFSQLAGVRVILGAVEAVFFPGVIYFLSAWYTRPELGKRLATLFTGQQLGNAFGGLIAAGITKLGGVHGLAGWQWLFIVEGSLTIGFGLIFAFFLPEYPQNARLLTPIQRDMAVWRLESEAGEGEARESESAWEGFKLALRDPKVWFLILINFWSQGMGSIINFFPTVVQALGYNPINTLLLTAPPYLFAIGVFYALTWLVDRNNKIYWTLMGMLSTSLIAFAIAIATLNIPARYFAIMLIPSSAVGPQIFLVKTINIHIARPFRKRAAAVALVNSIGGLANLWTSYLYYDPPHLYAAFGANFGMGITMMLLLTAYRFHVRQQNRALDAGGHVAALAKKHGVTQQQINLGWRYIGY